MFIKLSLSKPKTKLGQDLKKIKNHLPRLRKLKTHGLLFPFFFFQIFNL